MSMPDTCGLHTPCYFLKVSLSSSSLRPSLTTVSALTATHCCKCSPAHPPHLIFKLTTYILLMRKLRHREIMKHAQDLTSSKSNIQT